MFNTGPIFQVNYESTADIVINQGGTDSGKTYSIEQILCVIACQTQAPIDDPIITIVSSTVPDSKKGAYRTFQNILATSPFMNSQIKEWNKTDRVIHFKTGWLMEFVGTTTEQDAKQGKRQYLFANEANGIEWIVFWQMAKRTRIRTWIDYNPSAPFWAHEKLIGTTPQTNDLSATIQLIISDHRHNPFLSKEQHDKTENIRDPELWNVYARGITGNLTGLIYTTWREITHKEFPWDHDKKLGGLDFGYNVDPTAGVHMAAMGSNTIYVHELCYEPDIPARQLQQMYKAMGYNSSSPIYCDHDKDKISELRRLQMLALPARKGPNSIAPGITKVKEYTVLYTNTSKNITNERKKYMWLRDEVTGKFTNTPVDLDNHLMDAIRYGIYSHYFRGRAG